MAGIGDDAGLMGPALATAVPLADGAGTTAAQGAPTFLFLAAAILGWVAVGRLRGRRFARVPTPLAWAAAGLSVACVAAALIIPQLLSPAPAGSRPRSTARLAFVTPQPGQVLRGAPATVDVRLRLAGGRIVPFTSTPLVPNEGHVHLILDGALVSMTLALSQQLSVPPGTHTLVAQFVAVDHAPFAPPVLARVTFRVEP